EWILEQLIRLYDCQEEEIPELETDVDNSWTWRAMIPELPGSRSRWWTAFISGLLGKIRGMQKLSTPQ
ncbi:hypothetical protein E2I00_014241, partial [Balaenoptera physalus]